MNHSTSLSQSPLSFETWQEEMEFDEWRIDRQIRTLRTRIEQLGRESLATNPGHTVDEPEESEYLEFADSHSEFAAETELKTA